MKAKEYSYGVAWLDIFRNFLIAPPYLQNDKLPFFGVYKFYLYLAPDREALIQCDKNDKMIILLLH